MRIILKIYQNKIKDKIILTLPYCQIGKFHVFNALKQSKGLGLQI